MNARFRQRLTIVVLTVLVLAAALATFFQR